VGRASNGPGSGSVQADGQPLQLLLCPSRQPVGCSDIGPWLAASALLRRPWAMPWARQQPCSGLWTAPVAPDLPCPPTGGLQCAVLQQRRDQGSASMTVLLLLLLLYTLCKVFIVCIVGSMSSAAKVAVASNYLFWGCNNRSPTPAVGCSTPSCGTPGAPPSSLCSFAHPSHHH
jgi:hypothetical protein